MTRIRLEFVQEYRDRHGKIRRYFRRKGTKRITLPGLPGSDEFMMAYAAALGAGSADTAADLRSNPGSVSALIAAYYSSGAFRAFDELTKANYRHYAEAFRKEDGDKPVALLEQRHIESRLARRAATPSGANCYLLMLRRLMRFAIAQGVRKDDPTLGIRRLAVPDTGHLTWSEDHIAQYETQHPVGSQARLAMALMLYTGMRRGDVIRFGRQHIKNGLLTYTQNKNRKRKPVTLTIPVAPELQRIIDLTPAVHLTFLTTVYGRPFTASGFSNWMRKRCNEAGLPECSAHGLRKAISRRLAEQGCTSSQIAAITGHRTLREIERYTRAADQKRLAGDAMRCLTSVSNLDPEQEKSNG